MHVYRGISVWVFDVEHFPTAPGRNADTAHVAVGHSVDGLAHSATGTDVEAGMEMTGAELGESGTEANVTVERQLEIALW